MGKYAGASVVLLMTGVLGADVKTAAIFADHMVLQRDAQLPVWGWADPGESVRVRFAGQNVSTQADASGHWRVLLEPIVSDQPQTMTVTGKNKLRIADILMGEVWVCSGQSNMGFTVREGYHAAREIATANYPKIRHYEVERRVCPEPDRTLGGQWQICSPATAGYFTAVGYFFARTLHEELHVPIGLIHASWGGTPAEAWTQWQPLKNNPKLDALVQRFEHACRDYPHRQAEYRTAMQTWEHKVKLAQEAGLAPPAPPLMPMGPTHFQRPSGLYNGMIHSIVPYAIRGVIWYQGECNAGRGLEYAEVLPTMINNWRNVWGQGDFPFHIVQISSWGRLQDNPNEVSGWARVRAAQAAAARQLPNCQLVVTTDIGDADSNHPRNKQDVGARLALCALAHDYGRTELPHRGPDYRRLTRETDRLRIHFDYAHAGLASKLTGFVIAGPDLIYQWAHAHIEGDTVVVSSPDVPDPVSVRYAWADNPPGSLYNQVGLPAVPFQAQLPGLHVVVAAQDTYIDESQPDANFGRHMDLRIEDEGKPGSRRYTLIRWNLTNIDSAHVHEVVLRVTQTDAYIGDGLDVYAIADGPWNEHDITWNSWRAVPAELDFLGTMSVTPYPDGLSTLSSAPLTNWVRRCLAEPQQNHGLLLKYHYDTVYTGDTLFAAGDPEALYHPPQLIIRSRPEQISPRTVLK